jgi:prepilin-type N-terminal cleavage/methylation domain-containing protein
MKRTRRSQAGFTLLELLVTCAIIGTLAAIAVPVFAGETRRAKGDSEVSAFFTELRVREEQFQNENGTYLSTGASEAMTFPASPSASPQSIASQPATWNQLKVRVPESTARCAYVVQSGTPSTGAVGSVAATSFNFVRPTTRNWYYVLAHCDLDGDSSKDGYYFVSSDDPKVQSINAGH